MIFQTTATEILVGHTRNVFSISIFNVGYEIKKSYSKIIVGEFHVAKKTQSCPLVQVRQF